MSMGPVTQTLLIGGLGAASGAYLGRGEALGKRIRISVIIAVAAASFSLLWMAFGAPAALAMGGLGVGIVLNEIEPEGGRSVGYRFGRVISWTLAGAAVPLAVTMIVAIGNFITRQQDGGDSRDLFSILCDR